MAKNTQEAEVIVTLNGSAAKKAVEEMTQEYERLNNAAREAYKSGNDALGKKLDAQAQKLTKDIEISRKETKKFADILKNINGASLKELNSAAKQLRSEINKLTPGTQEFVNKTKQLQQVNTRIKQLTKEFKVLVEEEKRATFSLKGLADRFNKYFGMVTAGVAAITGLSMAFRKAAEAAAELDDVYSDVMKTTGLMHEEVAGLDQELMKINTRTSREQLLLLARDAGKLGITGKENILGFVRAADQIQVALGEDLGEGAIKELGKIADVFGLTKEMGIEKSLLSIASAVNALGQDSTASEAYLVEFTQRLAGVGAMAGVSVQNLLGFASGLDQSSMKVEMAATAFQKFLMKMYEDTATFAGYAGMQVEEFSDLLQNDANTAITTVLSTLNGKGGFNDLVPMFDQMGLDGARAVQVLSAMAKNLQAVTDAQALANVEFQKATSVTEEYNTKNNNMKAQLEKARKEFQNASITLGQSLNPIMLKSTKLTTYLIKGLATYGKEIKAVVIALVALTAVVKAQAIAEGIRAVALKIGNTLTATGTVLSNKMMAAYYRLTGQTMKMAAAQKAANAAMSSSVIGAIAVAVAALTFAIARYVNKMKEANKELQYSEELERKIADTQASEVSRVTALTKIVNDQNVAYEKRKQALTELKKLVPDYHASLTKEGKLINNNTEAIDQYVASLKTATRMKILEEEFTTLQAEMIKAEEKVKETGQALSDALTNPPGFGVAERSVYEQQLNSLGKAARDASAHLSILKKREEELLGKIGSTSQLTGSTTTDTEEETGGGGGGGIKQANKELDKTIAKLDEAKRKLNDLLTGDESIPELWGPSTSTPEIADPQANEAFWADIYRKRDDLISQLQDNSLRTQYDNEMMWLEKLHQNKLLSEETYEKLVYKTKMKYAQQYTEQVNSLSEKASNMVGALRDAELAKAEATYQAELTAAGDNAEKREQVEASYEQKKLDIQKKYANADMVINIAKTIGAGALAVMQGFAQLGPVAGAVAAALIGVMTAAQVATIIHQRNAIMNASVNSSASSASLNTGQRTINSNGYAEGGFTENHTTVTTVGERGTEFVAPAWMVRENPVVFSNLERYRKTRSRGRSGSISRGFADGGFTGSAPAGMPSAGADIEAAVEAAIRRVMADNAIRAFVVRNDITELDNQDARFKSITSR